MNKDKIKLFFKKKWFIIKEELTSESPKKLIKNNLLILLGAVIYAFAISFFIFPMDIISGGLSSLAIICSNFTNVVSREAFYYIFSWGLFIVGLFTLGIKYSLKTLVFTIANPLFIQLFDYLIKIIKINGVAIFDIKNISDIMINGTTYISSEQLAPIAYIVAACLGGLVMGVGIGLALAGGGSSGGTDVINLLAHKYLHVKVGTSSLICDLVIITAGFFTNGQNLLACLIAVISALLCSIMIDKVFLGRSEYYIAFIISKDYEKINQEILSVPERGTTLLKGEGGYTKEENRVLEVCFDKRDYNTIRSIINKIDPNAFITIVKASEIIGYGFTRNTPKIRTFESQKKDSNDSGDNNNQQQ